jgi:AcrR family transcriptional regulator
MYRAAAGSGGQDNPLGSGEERDVRGGDHRAILDAAERLLTASGARDLSVARLVSDARVSREAFAAHFPSTQALLESLVDRSLWRIYQAVLAPVPAEGSTGEAAIRDRLSQAAVTVDANRGVLVAAVENWLTVPGVQRAWIARMREFVDAATELISRERDQGRAPAGPDAKQLATTLVWSTERCVTVALIGVDSSFADRGDVIATIARLWWGTVYAPPPTESGSS